MVCNNDFYSKASYCGKFKTSVLQEKYKDKYYIEETDNLVLFIAGTTSSIIEKDENGEKKKETITYQIEAIAVITDKDDYKEDEENEWNLFIVNVIGDKKEISHDLNQFIFMINNAIKNKIDFNLANFKNWGK